MSSGDAGNSIIGNYFTDNYLMLQDVPIALNVLFVVVFNGYSRFTNISTTPRTQCGCVVSTLDSQFGGPGF